MVTDETKKEMKKILEEIQQGKFAREFVGEYQAGQTYIKAMRRLQDEHPIEEVGERLRDMMPWIKENRLVDREVN